MSCTTMLAVPPNGPMVEVEEFRDAWGSAMRIWNSLVDRYMPGKVMILLRDAELQEFWDLAKSDRLSRCERLAHAFTFDKAICERDRAYDLAAALREFDSLHPADGKVNHLPAIADALEKHSTDSVIGFAFVQTSVSGDVWQVQDRCNHRFHQDVAGALDDGCPECGNERDDLRLRRTFDWSKDSEKGEHFFIFRELDATAQTEEPQ